MRPGLVDPASTVVLLVGFSPRHLHENDRPGLEFLIRYVLRPPLALERMSELPDGKILLRFKRPQANGTAGIELTPMALMRRLASLVPPPGNHDTCYFGVFAPNAKWRSRLVRAPRKEPDCHHSGCEEREPQLATVPDQIEPLFGAEEPPEAYIPWAKLMKRVHKIDVLKCPCGGQRRFVGYVTEPEKIREGLEKLGLSCEAPKIAKARRPAQEEIFDRTPDSDGVDPPPPDWVA